jgi:hypothetical protein
MIENKRPSLSSDREGILVIALLVPSLEGGVRGRLISFP